MDRHASALSPESQVMVEMFPLTNYSNPRAELVGKYVICRDLHGEEFWQLKLAHFFKQVGDVFYFYYVPIPPGIDLTDRSQDPPTTHQF